MLSLSNSYDERRLIQVVIVSLGNNTLFKEQLDIVSKVREIPYFELNKPNFPKGYQSSFKFLNWNDGSILFEYKRLGQMTDQDNEFVDFQSSKRFLMVLGLVNYPEVDPNQWPAIEKELRDIAEQFPHMILKRFLVFNYNFENNPSPTPLSSSQSMKEDPEAVVIFPPDAPCEGGSMVEVHYRMVMCHAVVKLIGHLQKQMDLCEEAKIKNSFPVSKDIPLSTYHDDREDGTSPKEPNTNNSVKSKKLWRKKPLGRIKKWMGDLSMQVCSPLDAVDNYVTSINESRSIGDSLWLASALDGYASAILLLKKLNVDLEDTIGRDLRTVNVINIFADDEDNYVVECDRLYLLAEERAMEALSIYAMSPYLRLLEISSTMKIAMMFAYADAFYDQPRKVLEYVQRVSAVPGLSPVQQIECTVEGAMLCYQKELYRKSLLLLYIAAMMAADMGNINAAVALMNKALGLFALPSLERGSIWYTVQYALLAHLLTLYQESQDTENCAIVTAKVLSLMSSDEMKKFLPCNIAMFYNRKTLGLDRFGTKITSNQIPNVSNVGPDNISRRSIVSPNPTVNPLTEEALKRHMSNGTTSDLEPSVKTNRSRSIHSDATLANTTSLPNTTLAASSRAQSVNGDVPQLLKRMPTRTGIAAGDPGDFIGAHVNDLVNNFAAIRNITVPNISNRLSTLITKSINPTDSYTSRPRRPTSQGHAALSKKRQSIPNATSTLSGNSNRTIKKLLLELDSNAQSITVANPANIIIENSNYNQVELNYIRDMLEKLHNYLHSNANMEVMELYNNVITNVSANVQTYLPVSLPVVVCYVKPMEMPMYMKPIYLEDTALLATKAASTIKARLQSLLDRNDQVTKEQEGNTESKTSAFFYDPFKKKNAVRKVSNEVIWYQNKEHYVQLCLYNPLLVAVQVSRIDIFIDDTAYTYNIDLLLHSQTVSYQHIPIKVQLNNERIAGTKVKIERVKLFMNKLYSEVMVKESGLASVKLDDSLCKFLERANEYQAQAVNTNAIHIVGNQQELQLFTSWDQSANKIFSDPGVYFSFTQSLNNRFLQERSKLMIGAKSKNKYIEDSTFFRVFTFLSLLPNEYRKETIAIRNLLAMDKVEEYNLDYNISIVVHTTNSQKYSKVKKYLVKDFQYLPTASAEELLTNNKALLDVYRIEFKLLILDTYELLITDQESARIDSIEIDVEAYSVPKAYLIILQDTTQAINSPILTNDLMDYLTNLTIRKAILSIEVQRQLAFNVYSIQSIDCCTLEYSAMKKMQKHLYKSIAVSMLGKTDLLNSSSKLVRTESTSEVNEVDWLSVNLVDSKHYINMQLLNISENTLYLGFSLDHIKTLACSAIDNVERGNNWFEVTTEKDQYCSVLPKSIANIVFIYDKASPTEYTPVLYYAFHDASRALHISGKEQRLPLEMSSDAIHLNDRKEYIRSGSLCHLPSYLKSPLHTTTTGGFDSLPSQIYHHLTLQPFFQFRIQLKTGTQVLHVSEKAVLHTSLFSKVKVELSVQALCCGADPPPSVLEIYMSVIDQKYLVHTRPENHLSSENIPFVLYNGKRRVLLNYGQQSGTYSSCCLEICFLLPGNFVFYPFYSYCRDAKSWFTPEWNASFIVD